MPEIRLGTAADLDAVAAIQTESPGAAQWNAADYLEHELWVAVVDDAVAGFAVVRRITPDEGEILNIAVAASWRRSGLARALIGKAIAGFRGSIFLEVRESNTAAIALYKSLNFKPIGRRENYYDRPNEAAIVMKFHSC